MFLPSCASPGVRALCAVALVVLGSSLLVASPAAALSNCTAGTFCYDASFSQSSNVSCIPSQYCPGDRTAALCAKGYYCPTVLEQIECPEGSYCPPASTQPRPCSGLASCPKGSDRYLHWGCLVLLIIVLPCLAFAGKAYERFNNASKRASFQAMAATATSGPNHGAAPTSPKLFAASPHSPVEELAAMTDASLLAPASTLSRVPRMEIAFSNVAASVETPSGTKPILADVTGHFRAGRLIAVMVSRARANKMSRAGRAARRELREHTMARRILSLIIVAFFVCVCLFLLCRVHLAPVRVV